jgi:nucleoside-diphosphate-sugar epimerase
MTRPTIALAGAAGDLGQRIAKALVARGATVRAITRAGASAEEQSRLGAIGVEPRSADVTDVASVAAACEGASCVVSALNGLHEVIVDRQRVLIDAAVRAGVPRFISSDYSADFTKTIPGENRNFDLRREFMAIADRKPIRVTSILNGAFLDMLGAEMPIIRPRLRRVLHWGDADQRLDFTTKDDVAAYVAAAALDDATPRILRIAGDTVSARDIAAAMRAATGEPYRTARVGGIGALGVLIGLARLIAPQPRAAFPPWQGMQYLRDMFSGRGKLHPLDNDRYPNLHWTSVSEHLARVRRDP